MINAVVSVILILLPGIMLNNVNSDFKGDQKKATRVKAAYDEKESKVKKMVSDAGLEMKSLKIFIRIIKKDQSLELFGMDKSSSKYVLIKKYDVCASSGILGPKRKSGDRQVPEGFYSIDRFNPYSTFHLSLGIDYPNKSDRKLTTFQDPGGDIFIHGDCVTIGCVPLTDDKIKEVYILAVEARNNGQMNIPVHIFPVDLDRYEVTEMIPGYHKGLRELWNNLREGYRYFENKGKPPVVSVNSRGYYDFK